MCMSLLSMAQMAGPAVEAGGTMQAIAGGANALGDLAAGVTRARMNRADAKAEIAAGAAKALRIRAAGERELGTARAQASASGVKVTSGSVLEAERAIVRGVEIDAGVAMLNAERRADSLRQSADYYQADGLNSAVDGLTGAVNKWRGTRRKATGGWESILSSTRGTGD